MNGSWSSLLNKLTIPQGAKGGDPRFVVGPEIPPELIAWTPYDPTHTITWIAAELFYFDATNYAFTALVDDEDGFGVHRKWVFRGFYTAPDVCIYERFGPDGLSVNYYDSSFNQVPPYMLVDGHSNGVPGDYTMPGYFAIGEWVNFFIGGVSQGRGVLGVANSDNTASLLNVIDSVETAIADLPGPNAERCYSYELSGLYTSATSPLILRMRDTNDGAGTDLGEFGRYPVSPAFGMAMYGKVYVRNSGVTTRWGDTLYLNANVTGAGTAQFAATAATLVKIVIRDEGASWDFPGICDWPSP